MSLAFLFCCGSWLALSDLHLLGITFLVMALRGSVVSFDSLLLVSYASPLWYPVSVSCSILSVPCGVLCQSHLILYCLASFHRHSYNHHPFLASCASLFSLLWLKEYFFVAL